MAARVCGRSVLAALDGFGEGDGSPSSQVRETGALRRYLAGFITSPNLCTTGASSLSDGSDRNSDRIRGLTDASRRNQLSTPSGGSLINHVAFTMIALQTLVAGVAEIAT